MTATIYFQLLGTRGSRPILARDFVEFGGNTTAYKIWADSLFPIYVDGGSGLFREGARLDAQIKQFTFLLTHAHWDHILAFPFFKPLYHPNTYARFWGSPSFKKTFEELFKHQFQADAFPVNYSEIPSTIKFTAIRSQQTFNILPPPAFQKRQNPHPSSADQGYTISTYQINHPGFDLGYRITYQTKSIVILTDIAPITSNHLGHGMQNFTKSDEDDYYQGLIEFCWKADLLLHDTHFNEHTIKGKENWGHSTEIMATRLAMQSQVKQLILGHHAPEDNDAMILQKLDRARQYSKHSGLHVIISKEDEILTV
ncbi:hypothetical protein GF339_05285 [candidate division KSB3 bacterium]|uniref:Metallo-beta-lactamase domain-containing protein n=1 Tax=candidate division KSB3 bacterium TaxID=2044937 RepID=A0A9D5JTN8_9BACT|nr:hypothetical protein [candidate division KSB3 bacterium]MBD3323975.1 hypothetical protein [candidate division KSB3 bacterium]